MSYQMRVWGTFTQRRSGTENAEEKMNHVPRMNWSAQIHVNEPLALLTHNCS